MTYVRVTEKPYLYYTNDSGTTSRVSVETAKALVDVKLRRKWGLKTPAAHLVPHLHRFIQDYGKD